MDAKGSATEIRAEAPMSEVLDFAPDLRSISGGRADYTLEFERYEEVPGHLAAKLVDTAGAGAAVGP
jgi:elongation factor G